MHNRQVLVKDKSEWTKMRVKNAEYAHISKEFIRISFLKRNKDWIATEWVEQYPNDGLIQTCTRIGGNHVYIDGSVVALIKKFGRITQHKAQSSTDYFKELGITSKQVSIEFSDHKTYLHDSEYHKDGHCIASGSTIRVMPCAMDEDK